MNSIELDHTLPAVFSGRTDIASDLWLQHVSLERGKCYLLEAASGTGKTSLCSFLIGRRDDYNGRILFEGKDIRSLKISEWVMVRQRSLSCLFQDLALFPELTALENVEIKNHLTAFKTRNEIEQMFDQLGIADKMHSRVGLMSFGQQQRVALIRALAQPFDFLLADEPISHLDDSNARAMAELIMNEMRMRGAGLLVTSIGKHLELPYYTVFRL